MMSSPTNIADSEFPPPPLLELLHLSASEFVSAYRKL